MNREDIIRMAIEAGLFEPFELGASNPWRQDVHRELERFAALVAAAEREKLAKHFKQANQAGIHTDWVASAIRARGQA